MRFYTLWAKSSHSSRYRFRPKADVTHAASGKGVTQDYKLAVAWNRKAAEQGNAAAQFLLGLGYANGEGVAQDFKMAYVWSSVAAANGYSKAAGLRDLIATKLSQSQLEAAQKLAGQYFEKYQPKP